MIQLIILSIVIKLISTHFLIEIYREKKLPLPPMLLLLAMNVCLMIGDFFVLNYQMYKVAVVLIRYIEVLIFITSISLGTFIYHMAKGHKHIPEKTAVEASVYDKTLNSLEAPLIVVNEDNHIALMSKGFLKLMGLENRKNSSFATTLNRLLGQSVNFETLSRLDGQTIKINGPTQLTLSCRLKIEDVINRKQKIIYFTDESKEHVLSQQNREKDESLEQYDFLLGAGKWYYNFDDHMISCSDAAKKIIGLADNNFPYSKFEKRLHPEDLMVIELIDNKTMWLSGRHMRAIRLLIDKEIKYACLYYQTIIGEDGVPIGVEGIIQESNAQRAYLSDQFFREKNDHIASIVNEYNQLLTPVFSRIKLEDDLGYLHTEIDRVMAYVKANNKLYVETDMGHIINPNKVILDALGRLKDMTDQYELVLNVSNRSSLLAIDEMSFKKILGYMLSEVNRTGYSGKLEIQSSELNGQFVLDFIFGDCSEKQMCLKSLKRRLFTPPLNGQDETLYQTYTIVEKMGGHFDFIEQDSQNTIRVLLPSLSIDADKKELVLKRISYVGDYPVTSKIVNDFISRYEVFFETIETVESFIYEGQEVIIFDGSVPIGEQIAIAKGYPDCLCITLGGAEVKAIDNLVNLSVPVKMSEMLRAIGCKFLMMPKKDFEADSIEGFDLLDDLDRYNIDASKSCKNIGHNPSLYFECLKLYNHYYGNSFDHVLSLWQKNAAEQLEVLVGKIQDEASILGLTSIEEFTSHLQLNGYDQLAGFNGRLQSREATISLEKALGLLRVKAMNRQITDEVI